MKSLWYIKKNNKKSLVNNFNKELDKNNKNFIPYINKLYARNNILDPE